MSSIVIMFHIAVIEYFVEVLLVWLNEALGLITFRSLLTQICDNGQQSID